MGLISQDKLLVIIAFSLAGNTLDSSTIRTLDRVENTS